MLSTNTKPSNHLIGDDPINVHIGDLGRYQVLYWFCICFTKFSSAWVTLGHIFLAGKTVYKCIDPSGDDPCSDDCNKAEFNRKIYDATIEMTFHLVCDKKWLSSFSQMMVWFGFMVGSILFGTLADRYGRRITFNLACIMQLILGVTVSFAPCFTFYVILKWLLSFATGGQMSIGIVMIIELVGSTKLEIMSIMYHLPFNLGHVSLPVFAYFLRNWRYLQFSYSIISILYLTYIFFIYESPRWLFSTGRLDKAAAVLEKIAKWNKMPTEQIYSRLKRDYVRSQSDAGKPHATLIDLFANSFLCEKTLILIYEWISSYLLFNGVILFIAEQDGNKILYVSISGILGILATIISIFTTKYLGRRLSLLISNFISGIGFVVITIAVSLNEMVVICFAFVCSFSCAASCTILHLYSVEIYPTVIRSSGLGLCISIGRIGSMISPFVTRDLGHIMIFLPPIVYSVVAFIAFGLLFQLPETKHIPVLNRLEDIYSFIPAKDQSLKSVDFTQLEHN